MGKAAVLLATSVAVVAVAGAVPLVAAVVAKAQAEAPIAVTVAVVVPLVVAVVAKAQTEASIAAAALVLRKLD